MHKTAAHKPVGAIPHLASRAKSPAIRDAQRMAHTHKQADGKMLSHNVCADILIHRCRGPPFPSLGKANVAAPYGENSHRLAGKFKIRLRTNP